MVSKGKVSQPYSRMATYYDTIYHAIVDYKGECELLEKLFRKHFNQEIGSILDVGCGTGNHSMILAERGYRVVGIDASEAMLQVARRKLHRNGSDPKFRKMDMRRITLNERFDAAVILFGGFTYLLQNSDVESCFISIRNHLNKPGLLIFEFWHSSGMFPAAATSYGHRPWDRFEDQTGNRLLIRLATTRYDPLTNLLNVIFDHYVIDRKTRMMIDQFQETHLMRTYNITEIERLLHESGLNPLAFYEKRANDPPKPATMSSGRVICVATARRRQSRL